jgi:hypothetical protein
MELVLRGVPNMRRSLSVGDKIKLALNGTVNLNILSDVDVLFNVLSKLCLGFPEDQVYFVVSSLKSVIKMEPLNPLRGNLLQVFLTALDTGDDDVINKLFLEHDERCREEVYKRKIYPLIARINTRGFVSNPYMDLQIYTFILTFTTITHDSIKSICKTCRDVGVLEDLLSRIEDNVYITDIYLLSCISSDNVLGLDVYLRTKRARNPKYLMISSIVMVSPECLTYLLDRGYPLPRMSGILKKSLDCEYKPKVDREKFERVVDIIFGEGGYHLTEELMLLAKYYRVYDIIGYLHVYTEGDKFIERLELLRCECYSCDEYFG